MLLGGHNLSYFDVVAGYSFPSFFQKAKSGILSGIRISCIPANLHNPDCAPQGCGRLRTVASCRSTLVLPAVFSHQCAPHMCLYIPPVSSRWRTHVVVDVSLCSSSKDSSPRNSLPNVEPCSSGPASFWSERVGGWGVYFSPQQIAVKNPNYFVRFPDFLTANTYFSKILDIANIPIFQTCNNCKHLSDKAYKNRLKGRPSQRFLADIGNLHSPDQASF